MGKYRYDTGKSETLLSTTLGMLKPEQAQALKDARTRLQAEACEREPAIQLRLSDGASLAEPLAEDGGGADVNRRREEERDKDVRMEAVAGRGTAAAAAR